MTDTGICHLLEVLSEESKRLGAGGSPILVQGLDVRREGDVGLGLADPYACLAVLNAFSYLEHEGGNG